MRGGAWGTLLVVLFLASAVTRDARLLLFALFLLAASGASWLWVRYSLAEVHYTRHLRDRHLDHGGETELTLEVYNAKPLPLPWLLVSDVYPDGLQLLTGELNASRAISFRSAIVNFFTMRWYERVRRVYRVRGTQRGVFFFGPTDMYGSDLFGLRQVHRSFAHRDRLVVYPLVVPVSMLGLPAARPSGDFLAVRRVLDDPQRFRSVREYHPEDSLRYVHWKASARRGQLQTRVFDPSASRAVLIVLDVQTDERPYAVVPEHLELLATTAASLAVHQLEAGNTVGLVANSTSRDTNEVIAVPTGRRPNQQAVLLEAIAEVTGFRVVELPRMLAQRRLPLPYGATLVVVTARPTMPLQEALISLQDAGHPVVLLTVGEALPEITPQIESHHIGGADVWNGLESIQLA